MNVSGVKASGAEDVVIEVSGCTGEMASCNGSYEFDRMHRGKPLFVNVTSKGILHWYPDRDGGIWALSGKTNRPQDGYNFSQTPDESRPLLPPKGKWSTQRTETNHGSTYPMLKISNKFKKAHSEVGDYVLEVAGCTGELACCNGVYEYQRMHKGKPLFMNTKTQKGVFHWCPSRDGGVWGLAKGSTPNSGYNFSQTGGELPPAGQWQYQRFESNEGSGYPFVTITSKRNRTVPEVEGVLVEIMGCNGEMAPCNGFYEFVRMHKEKPMFVNKASTGVLHWCPEADGGFWGLALGSEPTVGYNFSQASSKGNTCLPPPGQWAVQRFETNFGSNYPKVKLTTKIKKALADVGGVVLDVTGCSGDMQVCNGEYEYLEMHKERPVFQNANGRVIRWLPDRDGGIWTLGKSTSAGYNFSQSVDPENFALPPAGQWKFQRFESNNGSTYPKIQILSAAGAMDAPVFTPRKLNSHVNSPSPRSSSSRGGATPRSAFGKTTPRSQASPRGASQAPRRPPVSPRPSSSRATVGTTSKLSVPSSPQERQTSLTVPASSALQPSPSTLAAPASPRSPSRSLWDPRAPPTPRKASSYVPRVVSHSTFAVSPRDCNAEEWDEARVELTCLGVPAAVC